MAGSEKRSPSIFTLPIGNCKVLRLMPLDASARHPGYPGMQISLEIQTALMSQAAHGLLSCYRKSWNTCGKYDRQHARSGIGQIKPG